MNQRGNIFLFLILGILIMILVGLGAYYLGTQNTKSILKSQQSNYLPNLQTSPAPMSNQSINNNVYQKYTYEGTSFEYPIGWGVAPIKANENGAVYNQFIVAPKKTTDLINQLTKQGTGIGGGKMDIIVISTYPKQVLNFSSDSTESVTSSYVTVVNEPATQYTIVYKTNLPGINIGDVFVDTIFDHGGTTYKIELEDFQYRETYDHLLNTFKVS